MIYLDFYIAGRKFSIFPLFLLVDTSLQLFLETNSATFKMISILATISGES